MDLKAIQQQVFDRSFTGLREQGFRQSGIAGRAFTCAYEGEAGRRCAVGQLMESSAERSFFDGYGDVGAIFRAADRDPDGPGGMLTRFGRAIGVGEDISVVSCLRSLLTAIQRAHDNESHPADMEQALRRVATNFNLTVPN